jgi:aminoglycoside phosphotransferase (APT) family kinase protein
MRTTVTLDADVQALLKDAAYRSGKPFKVTLNNVLRAALSGKRGALTAAPDWPTVDLGPPLVDLTKALALADELEDRTRATR